MAGYRMAASTATSGRSILNPGDIMRTLAKLDLMADFVIPGRDPELTRMKVIPDDYDIE